MKKITILFLGILFLLWGCSGRGKDHAPDSESKDQVPQFSSKKINYAEIGGDSLESILQEFPDDSTKQEFLFEISAAYQENEDSANFRHWNQETFKLAKHLKDSSNIAEAHWDLANFFRKSNLIDSSFFHLNKASVLFSKIGEHDQHISTLLSMAILQKNVKDYTGSEVTTAKAISLLKIHKDSRKEYIAANNLAIVFNQLEEYDRAVSYHKKAMHNATELEDDLLLATTRNNLGVVYQRQGNSSKAIETFQQALLLDRLKHKNPRLYAMLQDNIAYSHMKADLAFPVKQVLVNALALREKINHDAGIIINKIHLGDFYLKNKDTLAARKFYVEAKDLALSINSYDDALNVLLKLAQTGPNNPEDYLNKYISLNDSLQQQERAVRNKFARIRFETDEFIAENEDLQREKRYVLAGSLAVSGIILLIFTNLHQRSRNQKMKLEQEQQKSNEKIYHLLIAQQEKLEEGRHEEKKRISRELHDGILGKLFGARLMLENLNEKNDPQSIILKKKYLENLRSIENEVRDVSHDLNLVERQNESLIEIIKKFLEEQEILSGIHFFLKIDKDLRLSDINGQTKMNLFRIVQEATANAIKHAKAQKVTVEFVQKKEELLLIVRDDGKGFSSINPKKGIGIENMKSRVEQLNGNFHLSNSQKGATLMFTLPVSQTTVYE